MSDQMEARDSITHSLRKELHYEIDYLEAAIKSANSTIARARLAILQLSLAEDRGYAMENGRDDLPNCAKPVA